MEGDGVHGVGILAVAMALEVKVQMLVLGIDPLQADAAVDRADGVPGRSRVASNGARLPFQRRRLRLEDLTRRGQVDEADVAFSAADDQQALVQRGVRARDGVGVEGDVHCVRALGKGDGEDGAGRAQIPVLQLAIPAGTGEDLRAAGGAERGQPPQTADRLVVRVGQRHCRAGGDVEQLDGLVAAGGGDLCAVPAPVGGQDGRVVLDGGLWDAGAGVRVDLVNARLIVPGGGGDVVRDRTEGHAGDAVRRRRVQFHVVLGVHDHFPSFIDSRCTTLGVA